jgi:hypothetical protein
MKISITRVTQEHTDDRCWRCEAPLWREPARWNTEPYQKAFRLQSETSTWSRLICEVCSYLDAEDLWECFKLEIDVFETQVRTLRGLATETIHAPSEADRQQEDAIVAKWNRVG